MDSFANRLMLARAHADHISIREAADLCGIGRGAWTNWEKGARPVDIIDVAAVVAEKLGVDKNWLLFGGPLARPEARSLRRLYKSGGPLTIASELLGWSAPWPSPDRAGGGTPRGPINRGPRRHTRPLSAVPPNRRRPESVRPGNRPMAA